MTFGEKLRSARNLKGLTQKQLANLVEAKHNSVSDWENNKNRPDSDTIIQLCEVLSISPDYLLFQNSEAFSSDEQELIKKYRALDERGKETVKCVVEKEYSTNVYYYHDAEEAMGFLKSIGFVAAFNGKNIYSNEQILQMANAIKSLRNEDERGEKNADQTRNYSRYYKYCEDS